MVFFIIVGIALVLTFYYGGASIFNSGPIATGPGQGTGVQTEGIYSPPPPLIFGTTGPAKEKPKPGISPLQGAVRVSNINYSEEDFQREYMVLYAGGFYDYGTNKQKSISLDGWTVENNSGNRRLIPQASSVQLIDSPGPILLSPGEQIYLFSGDSPFGASFRENICSGYFNESSDFNPPLQERCPEFTNEDLLKQKFNSLCVDLIDRVPVCRQVRIGFEESAAGNDCIQFTSEHINYAGCVKDYMDKDGFFTGQWRVFMKFGQKLWNPLHDRVIIRDKDGLVVDEYSY